MGLSHFMRLSVMIHGQQLLGPREKMGVALVPESIATTYAQENMIAIKHANWITHLQLVWRKDHQVTPLMKKIIDAI